MTNDNIQANSEKKVVIELDNVRRDFLVGEETVHALKGVSFKIYMTQIHLRSLKRTDSNLLRLIHLRSLRLIRWS